RDCARGMRGTDPPGDLGVTGRGAGWYFTQRLPDPLLERRAANIERQVETDPRRFHEADDLRDQLLELTVPTDQVRLRKLVLQLASQRFGIVAEKNCANTAVAFRHQDGTKRTLPDCEADVCCGAAGPVCARRHSEYVAGFFVEACVRVVSGVVDRIGHRTRA